MPFLHLQESVFRFIFSVQHDWKIPVPHTTGDTVQCIFLHLHQCNQDAQAAVVHIDNIVCSPQNLMLGNLLHNKSAPDQSIQR